jgi:hypothetical protein
MEDLPHASHSSEHFKTLGSDPKDKAIDQVRDSLCLATANSITAAQDDGSLGYPSTQSAGTLSYTDLCSSSFGETPLQRFEAEPLVCQPYNTVSFFRPMFPDGNIMPQSQPSLNVAYNGSEFGAEHVDSFEV